MWMKSVTRKEFLDVIQTERPVGPGYEVQAEFGLAALYGADELCLIWREDPGGTRSLPAAVLVKADRRRDFLAWVLTYLPAFRPFTAYFRVVEPSMAERALQRRGPPSLGRLEEACLGLILGEAGTYLECEGPPRSLSLTGCASTYSFAMARGLSTGILDSENDPVSSSWAAARVLTRQQKLKLTTEELRGAWAVLLYLRANGGTAGRAIVGRTPPEIMAACMDLYSTGDIDTSRWASLTQGYPEISRIREDMRGPREERVALLERSMASSFSKKRGDETTMAFLSGYLASMIGPGSMDHLQLLTPYLDTVPTALVWYGLCAGLQAQSSLQNYSGGLGRRVLRDVLRNEHFLDRPHCDIALAELEVLVGSESGALNFRTSHQGQLELELVSCVTTVLRWPSRTDDGEELSRARPQLEEAQLLFAELDEALERVESIREKLVRMFGSLGVPRSGRERKSRRR